MFYFHPEIWGNDPKLDFFKIFQIRLVETTNLVISDSENPCFLGPKIHENPAGPGILEDWWKARTTMVWGRLVRNRLAPGCVSAGPGIFAKHRMGKFFRWQKHRLTGRTPNQGHIWCWYMRYFEVICSHDSKSVSVDLENCPHSIKDCPRPGVQCCLNISCCWWKKSCVGNLRTRYSGNAHHNKPLAAFLTTAPQKIPSFKETKSNLRFKALLLMVQKSG